MVFPRISQDMTLLARERAAKGWTQAQLAQAAGVSRDTISRMENWRPDSRGGFRELYAAKVAQALGVELGVYFQAFPPLLDGGAYPPQTMPPVCLVFQVFQTTDDPGQFACEQDRLRRWAAGHYPQMQIVTMTAGPRHRSDKAAFDAAFSKLADDMQIVLPPVVTSPDWALVNQLHPAGLIKNGRIQALVVPTEEHLADTPAGIAYVKEVAVAQGVELVVYADLPSAAKE